MTKFLWGLLPFCTMWVCWGIGWAVAYATGGTPWYYIPLVATLAAIWVVSLAAAIINISDG